MIEQLSDEWFAARIGKVTASRIADVVAKTRSGWGASRANYMAELIAERLTGTKADRYTNAAMQHGIETEPDARAAYEFFTDNEVELVGFVNHPQIEMSGASPDGLVGEQGLVEIKCPNTATHIDTLLDPNIPRKYLLQMQWQMACTNRQWCDFVSFDPRMPENMQILITRIERDDKLIGELEDQITEFLTEIVSKITQLQNLYDTKRSAA